MLLLTKCWGLSTTTLSNIWIFKNKFIKMIRLEKLFSISFYHPNVKHTNKWNRWVGKGNGVKTNKQKKSTEVKILNTLV